MKIKKLVKRQPAGRDWYSDVNGEHCVRILGSATYSIVTNIGEFVIPETTFEDMIMRVKDLQKSKEKSANVIIEYDRS